MDQEVFPHVGCRGPQLELFVISDNTKCTDLNRICLGLDLKLYNPDAKDAATPDNLTFSNNTLHSLFPHAELLLIGELISSSNNNYHHAAVVETELTLDPVSKKDMGRLPRPPLSTKRRKNLEVKNKIIKKLLIMLPAHFTSMELHKLTVWSEQLLLPGVILQLRFHRLSNLCALEFLTDLDADEVKSLDENPPVVVIEKSSLFVNKIVSSHTVKLSTERALTKSSAVYPYIKSSTKSIIIQFG